MKPNSIWLSTLIISLFCIQLTRNTHEKEKLLFANNCLSVESFLSTFSEFRPDKEDIDNDDLLQLLFTKYLKSNINLYLLKGKESDVFFDIYHDLVQTRPDQAHYQNDKIANRRNSIWDLGEPSYLSRNVIQVENSLNSGSLKDNETLFLNVGLKERKQGGVDRDRDEDLVFNSGQTKMNQEAVLQVLGKQKAIQDLSSSQATQLNTPYHQAGILLIDQPSQQILLSSIQTESKNLDNLSEDSFVIRTDSKSIYNYNRDQIDQDFKEQLASFDQSQLNQIRKSHHQVFGLTQEFFTLTETLRKRDFGRMAAIFRLFFVKYKIPNLSKGGIWLNGTGKDLRESMKGNERILAGKSLLVKSALINTMIGRSGSQTSNKEHNELFSQSEISPLKSAQNFSPTSFSQSKNISLNKLIITDPENQSQKSISIDLTNANSQQIEISNHTDLLNLNDSPDSMTMRLRLLKKQAQLNRLTSVPACIFNKGIPGVGSQFGFLTQSLISLEYYLDMKGAYQWILAKIFLDVAESLEFVFSEGFYLRRLGKSQIGLLAKREGVMIGPIRKTEPLFQPAHFIYIGAFKNIGDLSTDKHPVHLTKKHIKNILLLFHAFTQTLEQTHSKHFGYQGIDLKSCLKNGVSLQLKELCPVFIWNTLNKDPTVKEFFALSLELIETGKNDLEESSYIKHRDHMFLKKLLKMLFVGFKKMLILVIKSEHQMSNAWNGLGSGFFNDLTDEAGRLVREKQKEIDMDQMMQDMFVEKIGGQGDMHQIIEGLEVRDNPKEGQDMLGNPGRDQILSDDSPKQSPRIPKRMPSPFQLDEDFSDIIEDVEIQFGDSPASQHSLQNSRNSITSAISQISEDSLVSKRSIEFATQLNRSPENSLSQTSSNLTEINRHQSEETMQIPSFQVKSHFSDEDRDSRFSKNRSSIRTQIDRSSKNSLDITNRQSVRSFARSQGELTVFDNESLSSSQENRSVINTLAKPQNLQTTHPIIDIDSDVEFISRQTHNIPKTQSSKRRETLIQSNTPALRKTLTSEHNILLNDSASQPLLNIHDISKTSLIVPLQSNIPNSPLRKSIITLHTSSEGLVSPVHKVNKRSTILSNNTVIHQSPVFNRDSMTQNILDQIEIDHLANDTPLAKSQRATIIHHYNSPSRQSSENTELLKSNEIRSPAISKHDTESAKSWDSVQYIGTGDHHNDSNYGKSFGGNTLLKQRFTQKRKVHYHNLGQFSEKSKILNAQFEKSQKTKKLIFDTSVLKNQKKRNSVLIQNKSRDGPNKLNSPGDTNQRGTLGSLHQINSRKSVELNKSISNHSIHQLSADSTDLTRDKIIILKQDQKVNLTKSQEVKNRHSSIEPTNINSPKYRKMKRVTSIKNQHSISDKHDSSQHSSKSELIISGNTEIIQLPNSQKIQHRKSEIIHRIVNKQDKNSSSSNSSPKRIQSMTNLENARIQIQHKYSTRPDKIADSQNNFLSKLLENSKISLFNSQHNDTIKVQDLQYDNPNLEPIKIQNQSILMNVVNPYTPEDNLLNLNTLTEIKSNKPKLHFKNNQPILLNNNSLKNKAKKSQVDNQLLQMFQNTKIMHIPRPNHQEISTKLQKNNFDILNSSRNTSAILRSSPKINGSAANFASKTRHSKFVFDNISSHPPHKIEFHSISKLKRTIINPEFQNNLSNNTQSISDLQHLIRRKTTPIMLTKQNPHPPNTRFHSVAKMNSVQRYQQNGSLPDMSKYIKTKSQTRLFVEKSILQRLKHRIELIKQRKVGDNSSLVKQEIDRVVDTSLLNFDRNVTKQLKINMESSGSSEGKQGRKHLLVV